MLAQLSAVKRAARRRAATRAADVTVKENSSITHNANVNVASSSQQYEYADGKASSSGSHAHRRGDTSLVTRCPPPHIGEKLQLLRFRSASVSASASTAASKPSSPSAV